MLRAAALGDHQVAGVTRVRGGSKKGVYRLSCADGFSAILYVWSRAEDYWPADPDAEAEDVFTHASGLRLFTACAKRLEAAGVRIPRVYLADASHAVYPADVALVEDVAAGRSRTCSRRIPGRRAGHGAARRDAGVDVAEARGAGRQGRRAARPARRPNAGRCEQIVLDRRCGISTGRPSACRR